MELFDVREPFSTWSHALGLLLSIPATLVLWRLSRHDRSKRLGLLAFGLSLGACYAGSALFHAVDGTPETVHFFERLDHVGIHLLIAGTYTPLALTLLQGRWRTGTLVAVWGVTGVASILLLADRQPPPGIATAEYLTFGWGAIFCYLEIARTLSHRALRWLLVGGVLYTVGALINFLHWPVLWPGIVEDHEFFHLWVLAGSAAHLRFMLVTVVPHVPGTVSDSVEIAMPRPAGALARVRFWRRPSLNWAAEKSAA